MPKYQVTFDMVTSGTTEVEATSQEHAIRLVNDMRFIETENGTIDTRDMGLEAFLAEEIA